MRRVIIPLVFVLLLTLAAALPVAASSSDAPEPTRKSCGFPI